MRYAEANEIINRLTRDGLSPEIQRMWRTCLALKPPFRAIDVERGAGVSITLAREYMSALRALNKLIELGPDQYMLGAEWPLDIEGGRPTQLTEEQKLYLLQQLSWKPPERPWWRPQLEYWSARSRRRERPKAAPGAASEPIEKAASDG